MPLRPLLALVFILAFAAAGRAAEPGASAWARLESGSVRLIADRLDLGPAPGLRIGIQFDLAPGWKIYWRTPGEAGYPPKVDWSGSDNLAGAKIVWPAPHRFVLAGLQNFGYVGTVVLPVEATRTTPTRPLALHARLDFLACAIQCVPQSAELDLALPLGVGMPSPLAHEIDRFAALVPGDGLRQGLTLGRVEGSTAGAAPRLRVELSGTEPFEAPDLFVEGDDIPVFEAPTVRFSPDRRRAVFDLGATGGTSAEAIAGRPLTLTIVDGPRTLAALVMPAPWAATGSGGATLPWMVLIALLGGLVLNLMPCVLPVLSIKILGVLGYGGAERRHVRVAFLASAAGILASFLALAGLAIALRATGAAFGWGIQFQQPGFLALMSVLLGLFAANLWGLFDIPLPSWLFRPTPGGIAHHTVAGHFLSGAFATVLATPCSAPFLGTAVGFALARGPVEIVTIFAALGFGMAAPFLLVASWPGLATRLPRPGAWMVRVRALLGLALAATAAWLLFVLAVQAGGAAAAIGGGAILATIGVLAATRHRRGRAAWALVAGLALLGLAGPLVAERTAPAFTTSAASPKAGKVVWVPFDPERLSALVAEGQVVFVDVTAEWCLTCKVNKATLIERGTVAARLSAPGVVAMQADWTRPDPRIAAYLARFGRYGIPFDAVHGPAAPDGIALSELPGEAELLSALGRARGGE